VHGIGRAQFAGLHHESQEASCKTEKKNWIR
jgi:hypothetical protein